MKALDELQLNNNNNNNNERTCIYLSNLHSLKIERKSRGSFGCLFVFFFNYYVFFSKCFVNLSQAGYCVLLSSMLSCSY